jgi:DNA-binding SARP family transcriptional activator
MLSISLLGTVRFRYGTCALRLRLPHNALRLLVYLLLEPGPHGRERVAFRLWPDESEAGARANLRRYLHLIGRALPCAERRWLIADATTVGWNREAPLWLDVDAFERACAGEGAETAVGLYHGHLLQGWDEPWLLPRRERAFGLLTQTLSVLCARARAEGDLARAMEFLQRLRDLDPWREDTVRASIGLRYERGDRAGAMAEYDRFARALQAEFGVEPMPETQALYETLRDDLGFAAAECVAESDETSGLLPFVGRANEIVALDAAWQRALAGSGSTLMLVGEAGAGKSRLVDEFCAAVRARGGRALVGRTSSVEAIPLQAFADALRTGLPLLRGLRIEPAWLGVLAALVPQLRVDRPDLPEPPPLGAPEERTRLFEAVARVLAALARVRPLLLVFEDLHWAGASTLSLLEYVARRATAQRLLIAATWRDAGRPRLYALADLRRRLEAERLATALPIGRLDRAAIGELLAQLIDEPPSRRETIADELHRRCDGNALFLHETLRAYAAAGVLDAERRRWNEAAMPAQLRLSDGLAALLRERLERLSPDARNVAEIAAVVGRTFSLELVRDVAGIDERYVLDALDRLIDERIVHESAIGGDYTFTHHLVRSAFLEAMPATLLRRRHRRVASVLEALHSGDAGELAIELADHYDRGDEPQRASVHYARAAAGAAAVFANHEALEFARRGLELADDARGRVELLSLCEMLYGRVGEREEQRAAAVRLAGLAAALGDPELFWDALRRRVELERACGDAEAEREALAAFAAAGVR